MRAPHVVIVIANLPVARDRRVQREAASLRAAGARVTVICPADPERRALPEELADLTVIPYRLPFAGSGALSFALEFAWSFVAVAGVLARLRLQDRYDGVQYCNPPDVFWPLMYAGRLGGVPQVFDHHDLSPEVYAARGPGANPAIVRVLRWLERRSLRAASGVVCTNESFREMARTRGGRADDRVVVVRNGPLSSEVLPTAGACTDNGHRHRVVYLGVMGAQDGVDAAVHMAALLAERTDVEAEVVFVGDGECRPALEKLVAELGIAGTTRFAGWLDGAGVARELAAACVGVQPDPPSPLASLSTMAKTVEYLSHGVPVVAVDLLETRRSAADAAVYVPAGSARELADAVAALLADPAARERMSAAGQQRARAELSWDHQAQRYVALFRRLLARGPAPLPEGAPR
ncbi:MAG: glycosyltransferase family 4 protein [Actinomycetota bacterium]